MTADALRLCTMPSHISIAFFIIYIVRMYGFEGDTAGSYIYVRQNVEGRDASIVAHLLCVWSILANS